MTSRDGVSAVAGWIRHWTRAPEARLASWGVLLNLAWEALQSPLFADWQREWGYLLWSRLHCTLGDVVILLISFWGVALLLRSRRWWSQGDLAPAFLFLAAGFGYTVWSERLNTGVRGAWEYAPAMPQIFSIGLTPLAQWIIVPGALLFLMGWRPRKKTSSRRTAKEVNP